VRRVRFFVIVCSSGIGPRNGYRSSSTTFASVQNFQTSSILQGWIDVPLNELGRRQAYELADALAGSGFSRIVSSPLRRASETVEIIADAWRLPPPTLHEGLKERYFGLIQGKPKSELSISHPGLHQEITRRNPACHFDEGESLDHFADRVLESLVDIARQNPTARILVITHGWVMDVITRHTMHLPRTAVLKMKRKNGESLWLEVTSGSKITESDAS
jgi:probable phosphoglycerate mutase